MPTGAYHQSLSVTRYAASAARAPWRTRSCRRFSTVRQERGVEGAAGRPHLCEKRTRYQGDNQEREADDGIAPSPARDRVARSDASERIVHPANEEWAKEAAEVTKGVDEGNRARRDAIGLSTVVH